MTDSPLLILAARIDELMAERAMNQAMLARLMQTNRATVCRLLQGYDSKMSTYLRALEVLQADVVVRSRPAP